MNCSESSSPVKEKKEEEADVKGLCKKRGSQCRTPLRESPSLKIPNTASSPSHTASSNNFTIIRQNAKISETKTLLDFDDFSNDSLAEIAHLLDVDEDAVSLALPSCSEKNLLPSNLHPPILNLIVESFASNNGVVTCKETSTTEDSSWSVVLKDFWLATPLRPRLQIRLIFPEGFRLFQRTVELSQASGIYLIVEPDVLVQSTAVASGVYCRRRAVLNNFFKSVDDGAPNKSMAIGIAVHSLFQSKISNLSSEIRYEDLYSLETLYCLGMTPDQFRAEVKAYESNVTNWIEQNIYQRQSTSAATMFKNSKPPNPSPGTPSHAARIPKTVKVRDIEESIWCPRFGLRGKIDVCLEAAVDEDEFVEGRPGDDESKENNAMSCGGGEIKLRKRKRKLIIPLELKTGKSSNSYEHQCQVLLYKLMLSSIVSGGDQSTAGSSSVLPTSTTTIAGDGILLYLKDLASHNVTANIQTLQGVIQIRNELAFYMSSASFQSLDASEPFFTLPEPLDNTRSCQYCPQQTNCSVFQRVLEKDRRTESDFVQATLEHLDAGHIRFALKWIRWLMMEMETAKRRNSSIKAIWDQSSSTRLIWRLNCLKVVRERKTGEAVKILIKSLN